MTIMHITIEPKHWNTASTALPHAPFSVICNKAIEIALAEQENIATDTILRWVGHHDSQLNAQQETYISAEEARKLGVGNAEWRLAADTYWKVVGQQHSYLNELQYRATQAQPIVKNEHFQDREGSVPAIAAHREVYFQNRHAITPSCPMWSEARPIEQLLKE